MVQAKEVTQDLPIKGGGAAPFLPAFPVSSFLPSVFTHLSRWGATLPIPPPRPPSAPSSLTSLPPGNRPPPVQFYVTVSSESEQQCF